MEFLFIAVGCIFGLVMAFLFFRSKQNESRDTSVFDSKIIELDKEIIVLQTNLINMEKGVNALQH